MFSFPVLALIFSNLIPVFGVIFDHWNASAIIFLYWFEGIVIGLYNILKMILAQKPDGNTVVIAGYTRPMLKWLVIPFYIIHYGTFTLAQGTFVFILIIKNLNLDASLLLAIASLFMSHGISFIFNYLGKKEYQNANIAFLMLAPYKRVFVMQFTLILSTPLAFYFKQNLFSLILLVTFKTIADLGSHLFEHKHDQTYVLTPLGKDLVKPIMPAISDFAEDAYRLSVQSGQFAESAKSLDPEMVKYIQTYYATPKPLRATLKPPSTLTG